MFRTSGCDQKFAVQCDRKSGNISSIRQAIRFCRCKPSAQISKRRDPSARRLRSCRVPNATRANVVVFALVHGFRWGNGCDASQNGRSRACVHLVRPLPSLHWRLQVCLGRQRGSVSWCLQVLIRTPKGTVLGVLGSPQRLHLLRPSQTSLQHNARTFGVLVRYRSNTTSAPWAWALPSLPNPQQFARRDPSDES
jgi:hypothetical protein